MIAIQLVSGRIGRVTGKGLAANVMELAPRWLVLALISLLVAANTFNIAADIAAMGIVVGDAFNRIVAALEHCIAEHFMDARHQEMWTVVNEPEDVLDAIQTAPRWSAENRDFAVL